MPGAQPSRDANGRALPAKFRFYVPGATLSTPKTVYTDDTLIVAHPFPILSDSAGRWPQMWADEAESFDVGWTDQVYDATIRVFTDVSPADDAVLASADIAEAAAAAAVIAQAGAEAAEAQAEAIVADQSGAPFQATSSTNMSVATGTKIFVLNELGKLFSVGQTVVIAETSAPATNQMTGIITDFDGTNGHITVSVGGSPLGSGSHADWTISLGATGGVPVTRAVATAGLATGGGDLSADRTITVPAAAAADVRVGTDSSKSVVSAALVGAAAFVALTDGATIATDASLGFNFKVTLGGNRAFGAPTNLKDGVPYTWDISQDASGSRIPSFDTIFDWGLSGAPTFSTGANKKDKVVGQYSSASGKVEASFRKSA